MSALSHFTAVWDDGALASDLGTQLTCTEVEALCALFEASGDQEAAQMWREAHAAGDDEGDDHYVGDDTEAEEKPE
jgi:hypothetical protein